MLTFPAFGTCRELSAAPRGSLTARRAAAVIALIYLLTAGAERRGMWHSLPLWGPYGKHLSPFAAAGQAREGKTFINSLVTSNFSYQAPAASNGAGDTARGPEHGQCPGVAVRHHRAEEGPRQAWVLRDAAHAPAPLQPLHGPTHHPVPSPCRRGQGAGRGWHGCRPPALSCPGAEVLRAQGMVPRGCSFSSAEQSLVRAGERRQHPVPGTVMAGGLRPSPSSGAT